MKSTHNILRIKRIEKGLTLYSAAIKLSITESAMSRFERKERVPNLYTAIKLADLYGMTLEEIAKYYFPELFN